jgi:formate/nitrite transporter FocA (FNT family)
MQMFTENTITPILPLFLAPTRANYYQTARLWSGVLIANLVGCAAAALVLVYGHILPDARFEGILSVSRHYEEATALERFTWGIPADFISASLVWMLPRMESAGEVLTIMILTYMIGLGGISHMVAARPSCSFWLHGANWGSARRCSGASCSPSQGMFWEARASSRL